MMSRVPCPEQAALGVRGDPGECDPNVGLQARIGHHIGSQASISK